MDDLPPRGAADGRAGARPPRRLLRAPTPAAGAMSAPLLEVARRRHDLRRRRPVLAPARSRAVDDVSFALEAGRPGDLHHHRRIRQRQDDARAHDPRHRAAERRHASASAAPTSRRSAAARARLAFMRQVQPIFQNPFEAFNPLKRVDRYLFVTARRFAGARERRRDRGQRRRGAAQGRPVAGRGARPLPARAVGRPAAARRDRPRADLAARADRRRRAGVDGRRLAAHVDRQPVARRCATSSASRSSTSPTISPPPTTSATASSSCSTGSVVESGDARAVLDNPQHPYSHLLQDVGAVARRRAGRRRATRRPIRESPQPETNPHA